MDDAPPRITVLSRPGCHLCEVAVATVAEVAAELGVGWEERSITTDPELERRYRELIPVVLVDGVEHDRWRVDADTLRRTLSEPPRGPRPARWTSRAGSALRWWRRPPAR